MTPGEVERVLSRHGLALRSDLGQNFLVDARLAERIVQEAGVQPGDRVLEIGTGLGALTRALAARGARVTTLEIDAGLVRALRAESLLPEGVELHHVDALRADLGSLLPAGPGPARLVANLPYSVSAPLLRRLLDLRGRLADWSVMLQREVAARVRAQPGTGDYGSLAVLHHLCVRVVRRLDLSPGCFHPRPKVRSTLLSMEPLDGEAPGADELSRVERVVRAAFGTRRKTIANALAASAGWGPETLARALSQAGVDPGERAEQVSPERFLRLARALEG